MKKQIIAPSRGATRTKRTTSKADIPSNVLPFRRPAKPAAEVEHEPTWSRRTTLLRAALAREERGELTGLIMIEATEEGQNTTVQGDFALRMEFGQHALIKALNIMADKIAEGGDAGYSTSPPIRMRSIEEVPHV
jgi:hypothetical protein